MTTTQIYHITTEEGVDGNGIRTVGYATGNPDDIKEFYGDGKAYTLTVEPLKIFDVTPQAVQERKALLHEYQTLEARLRDVKTQLGK